MVDYTASLLVWGSLRLAPIKNFAISLSSQPFLGHHLGFHIFFHNGLFGAAHFFTAGLFWIRYIFSNFNYLSTSSIITSLQETLPMSSTIFTTPFPITTILSDEDNTYTGDNLEIIFSTSGVLWNLQSINVQ